MVQTTLSARILLIWDFDSLAWRLEARYFTTPNSMLLKISTTYLGTPIRVLYVFKVYQRKYDT